MTNPTRSEIVMAYATLAREDMSWDAPQIIVERYASRAAMTLWEEIGERVKTSVVAREIMACLGLSGTVG